MLQLALVWGFLMALSLLCRPLFPIDETRYVTVAWDMWQSGDFLVPHLNGEPYSHKPPLLFWLMNLGWALLGVNEVWPRLVPSLFALGSVWMTLGLAKRLWPDDAEIAHTAPLILFGSMLWMLFSTMTMFDMLIAFFTLVGMHGIVSAWAGRSRQGWLLVGLAFGGGLLAKGPTILLQILPVVVLAPWWAKGEAVRWRRWYLGLLGALALGALVALAWAIPAGLRGGPEYQRAIFWGQTAHRVVDSFAHQRPFWWYLPLLPLMFSPWLLWLPVWRGLGQLRGAFAEPGVRFCLAWLLPVLLAFSLISGKQAHYLLPIFPAFALLAARGLTRVTLKPRWDGLPLALVLALLGVAPFFLHDYALAHGMPLWLAQVPPWSGIPLLLSALLLPWWSGRDRVRAAWRLLMLSVFIVTVLHLSVIRAADTAYDMRPISLRLKQLEDAGVPVVHTGDYPGIFNFIGRLKRSPEILFRHQFNDWFAQHPDGRAIVYFNSKYPQGDATAEFIQDCRGGLIAIVNRAQWQAWWRAYQAGESRPAQEAVPADHGD